MFLEKFGERGNWNVECVISIMLLNTGLLGNGGNSSRFLKVLNERFWLGVDGVYEGREGVLGRIVEKSAFLEKKGDILFSSRLSKS